MMAAQLIDEERLNEQQQDEEQLSNLPEEDSQFAESTQNEVGDEIPEKYAGKSIQEIVKMHQEAEKLVGRQSTEVGDLRKVVDQYIQTQLSTQQQAPQQVEEDTAEEIDFFSDPEKAVQRAIDNHPKVKQAEEFNSTMRKNSALQNLQQKHPDMSQILANPAFGEWIQGSKIRTQLFVQADKQYDSDAADELFTLWKERQGVVSQTVEAEKQTRKQAVKQASTGSATGSLEGASRKIYRRADIIKLMKTDPDRYASLSDEIMKAYSEGRVK